MNSKQRRVARRAMPKTGTVISWKTYDGKIKTGTVVEPRNNDEVFSLHRVFIRMESGAYFRPLLSRLIK